MKLILISGLPGTGKTTVAKKLQKIVDATLIRSDVLRRQIIKNLRPPYPENEKRKVYEKIFDETRQMLASGKNVILDATFAREAYRDRARAMAKEFRAEFVILATLCPESIVRQRMLARTDDASQATFERDYLEHKKIFQPIRDPYFAIDTSRNIDEQLAEIFGTTKKRP